MSGRISPFFQIEIQNGCHRRSEDEESNMMTFYNDDGREINPELVSKPSLCIICIKDEDPNELILCTLNRMDQSDEQDFKCYAYTPKS